MPQQKFDFHQSKTINIYPLPENRPEPEIPESMEPTLKARFTPTRADEIRAFCSGRKITTSDYLRKVTELDPIYFDEIEILNRHKDLLFPLLKRLSKNF